MIAAMNRTSLAAKPSARSAAWVPIFLFEAVRIPAQQQICSPSEAPAQGPPRTENCASHRREPARDEIDLGPRLHTI